MRKFLLVTVTILCAIGEFCICSGNELITDANNEFLQKTYNSRYGDVTIIDDKILPQLQGKWRSNDSDYVLEIKGNVMTCRYGENGELSSDWQIDEIIAIHYNDDPDPEQCKIINKNPAMECVCTFTPFDYKDGKLSAYEIIMDANSPYLTFEKVTEDKLKIPNEVNNEEL